MEKKIAKQIAEMDNVATCVADIAAGETVYVRLNGAEKAYIARQDIPFGHKIAVKDVDTGAFIYKYGQAIGKATKPICVGEYVHTCNVVDHYEVH